MDWKAVSALTILSIVFAYMLFNLSAAATVTATMNVTTSTSSATTTISWYFVQERLAIAPTVVSSATQTTIYNITDGSYFKINACNINSTVIAYTVTPTYITFGTVNGTDYTLTPQSTTQIKNSNCIAKLVNLTWTPDVGLATLQLNYNGTTSSATTTVQPIETQQVQQQHQASTSSIPTTYSTTIALAGSTSPTTSIAAQQAKGNALLTALEVIVVVVIIAFAVWRLFLRE